MQCLTRCRAELVGAQLLHLRLDWRPPIEQTRHHPSLQSTSSISSRLIFLCNHIVRLCHEFEDSAWTICKYFSLLNPEDFSFFAISATNFQWLPWWKTSVWTILPPSIIIISQYKFLRKIFFISTTIKLRGTTVKIKICWKIWCSSWRKNWIKPAFEGRVHHPPRIV